MEQFDSVAPALAAALSKRGYAALTPVQVAVLAPEAENADLLVSAQTGSGKTVAFGLAMAQTLLTVNGTIEAAGAPLALVVAPTRELALQVAGELSWLYGEAGARIVTSVGGMDPRKERRALDQGAHIVVGTPGRLRDHIERGGLDLSAIRVAVLDEADEMLDLGFREDLEFILDAAPSERRTLLFSATVPKPIVALARRFQRDALRISTAEEREPHGDIEYRALAVAPNERENAIINVLRFHEAQNAIVFCSTREAVKHLTARLANRGFQVVALSGELTQNERSHALQAMRDARARVCVATDVAARGIDLPNLDLVIHADLPINKATLLHRSGRTGRAGRKGVCALIVPITRRRKAEWLLSAAGVDANWAPPPSAAEIIARDQHRLLSDPALKAQVEEDERSIVAELVSRHSAEQLATAYVRLALAGLPAPEDLIEAPVFERPREKARTGRDDRSDDGAAPRQDFEGGVWFKVSLGRKHRAEPRWLLPLICRAGHVTRREVGSIRILEAESRFEIAPQVAKQFWSTIRRDGTGEKSVVIVPLESSNPYEEPSRRAAEPGRQAGAKRRLREKSAVVTGGKRSAGPQAKKDKVRPKRKAK